MRHTTAQQSRRPAPGPDMVLFQFPLQRRVCVEAGWGSDLSTGLD